MKWFKGVKDLNELRRLYRSLAIQHHPDKGGDTAIMQEINNEYDEMSQRLIDGNVDFSEARKTYESQVSEDLKDMVGKVINLEGVVVEIIGSWIWLTGSTKEHKEYIKECGFKFSRKKVAWYWHSGRYRKFTKKNYDLDSIRSMWGSEKVEKDEREENRVFNPALT